MFGQRKVSECLTMNPALPLRHLQSHGPQQLALRIGCNLKFRNPLAQIVRGQMHAFPEFRQLAEIIQGRSPHTVIHRAECNFKSINAKCKFPLRQ